MTGNGYALMKTSGSEISVNGGPAESPVLKVRLGDDVVTVRFSAAESDGVKKRIRDILTSSYAGRLQALSPETADE